MESLHLFCWHAFDLDGWLEKKIGQEWADEIIEFAKKEMKKTPILPRSTTSREEDRDSVIHAAVVDGMKIRAGLHWLYRLYRSEFMQLASKACATKAIPAVNDVYAINLNVQIGTGMRYECHVDSNPVQGMLYVTSHDCGGELIVANNRQAKSVTSVLQDCTVIKPKRGLLIFFDARLHSHFVKPLAMNNDMRVAVAMNYYNASCPESKRPKDLSTHLGLV